jgi:hypothetical protein
MIVGYSLGKAPLGLLGKKTLAVRELEETWNFQELLTKSVGPVPFP